MRSGLLTLTHLFMRLSIKKYFLLMNLYFAYGSNMDEAQMRERCPGGRLRGNARLRGYRLAFTIYAPHRDCGAADIVADEGGEIYGLLYELEAEDITRLDALEGTPHSYRRIVVNVEADGKTLQAFAYEVVHKMATIYPSAAYLAILKTAAQAHSFPAHYLKTLDAIELTQGPREIDSPS